MIGCYMCEAVSDAIEQIKTLVPCGFSWVAGSEILIVMMWNFEVWKKENIKSIL